MYRNVQTRVRHKGMLSDPFPVFHGTRQGGKSSQLLYLTYINGLIDELQNSGYGRCMYAIKICAPTVADDMVLMSYCISEFQKIIDICDSYSKRWRFLYNVYFLNV